MQISLAGDTPGPLGMGQDGASPANASLEKVELKCLAIHRKEASSFLSSVATIVAMDKLTVVQGGANIPGYATGPFVTLDQQVIALVAGEISIAVPDRQQMERERDSLVAEYIQKFVRAVNDGSAQTIALYQELEIEKNRAKASLDTKYARAQNYNHARIEGFKTLIQTAATVKFASGMTLATAGLVFGGWQVFAIGLGYELITKAIEFEGSEKPDEENASLVLVLSDKAVSETKKEVTSGLADYAANRWEKHVQQVDQRVEKLLDEMQKLDRQIQNGRSNRKKIKGQQKRYARTSAAYHKEVTKSSVFTGAAKRTQAIKWLGKSIGVVFWADSALEAYEELIENLESAK